MLKGVDTSAVYAFESARRGRCLAWLYRIGLQETRKVQMKSNSDREALIEWLEMATNTRSMKLARAIKMND